MMIKLFIRLFDNSYLIIAFYLYTLIQNKKKKELF